MDYKITIFIIVIIIVSLFLFYINMKKNTDFKLSDSLNKLSKMQNDENQEKLHLSDMDNLKYNIMLLKNAFNNLNKKIEDIINNYIMPNKDNINNDDIKINDNDVKINDDEVKNEDDDKNIIKKEKKPKKNKELINPKIEEI